MKFTKFATILGSVTAIAAVTPTLVACNKGDNTVINYGDSVNCLEEVEGKKPLTLDNVKNATKNHVNVESRAIVKSVDDLMQWNASDSTTCQQFYYDFIYSMACANVQFILTWVITDEGDVTTITFKYKDGEQTGEEVVTGLSYVQIDNNKVGISINGFTKPSQMYRNTTIKGA